MIDSQFRALCEPLFCKTNLTVKILFCLLFIALILVGVELPFVLLSLSQNAITCFLESSQV